MNDFGEPRGFQWDGGNYEKNWLRHGVTNAEAEQIFSNSALVIAEPESQIWGELRYYAYGQTDEDRKLFVVFTFRRELLRIISARDMSRQERSNYDDAKETDPQI